MTDAPEPNEWPPPPPPDPQKAEQASASPGGPTSKTSQPVYFWLTVAGAAAVVVGAFLPWVTATAAFVGTITRNGTDGDGRLTLALGAAVGILALTKIRSGPTPPRVFILVGLLAVAIGAIAGYDWRNLNDAITGMTPEQKRLIIASVGNGVYLTLGGAVAILVGAIMGNDARRKG
jgi:hypothetical protein